MDENLQIAVMLPARLQIAATLAAGTIANPNCNPTNTWGDVEWDACLVDADRLIAAHERTKPKEAE